MLLKGPGHHQDIIQVHKAVAPFHACQDKLHDSLKCRRGITESEGHTGELKEALVGGKCRFGTGFLIELHLPVSRRQVQRCKELGSSQCVEDVFYSR